jgi:arylsulfatase
MWLFFCAQVFAGQWLDTFKKFPPRQKPEEWNLSEIMERVQAKPVNQ